jgi:hypothetical protein
MALKGRMPGCLQIAALHAIAPAALRRRHECQPDLIHAGGAFKTSLTRCKNWKFKEFFKIWQKKN